MVPNSQTLARSIPTDSPVGHAAVAGTLAGALIVGSTLVLPVALALMLAAGICLAGTFFATEMYRTTGDGEMSTGRKASCGCGTLEQEQVDLELRGRDRLVGSCCVGVAAAAAISFAVLVVL